MTQKQKAILEATSGIRDTYIEEAATKQFRSHHWGYKTAIAAVLAFVLLCMFLLPNESSAPLFSVSVMADDTLNVTIIMTAELLEEIPAELNSNWQEREVFCVEIRMQGASQEYLNASQVTVEYDGNNVTQSATFAQLDIRFPEMQNSEVLCRIYGWAKDMEETTLNFTVTVSNTMDESNTVLCEQPFRAFYNRNRLIVNCEVTNNTKWYFELASTERLLDMILKDGDSPMFLLQSQGTAEHFLDLTRRWYAEIVAVLDTREDAGSAILKKLQQIYKMDEHEYTAKYANQEGPYVLLLLLQGSYYDQLTEEEIAQYEQLGLPFLFGD